MTTQQQPTTTNTRAAGHFSRPRCSVSAGPIEPTPLHELLIDIFFTQITGEQRPFKGQPVKIKKRCTKYRS